MQAGTLSKYPESVSVAFRRIYRQEGMRGLYRVHTIVLFSIVLLSSSTVVVLRHSTHNNINLV